MYDLDNERKLNPEGQNDRRTEWQIGVTLYARPFHGGGIKTEVRPKVLLAFKTESLLPLYIEQILALIIREADNKH